MADDYAGDTTTTGVFAPDGTASGVLEIAGDVDWFATTVGAGQTLQIQTPYLSQYSIHFYDAAGHEVRPGYFQQQGPGVSGLFGFSPTISGTYFVAVSATGSQVPYTLVATYIDGQSPLDFANLPTLSQSGEVPGGWFAAELQAGQTIIVDGDGAQAFDAYGNRLSPSAGLITVNAAGTYYLKATGTQVGVQIFADDYADQYADQFPTSEPIGSLAAPSSTVHGVLNPGNDTDLFAINLLAGQTIQLNVSADQGNLGTLSLTISGFGDPSLSYAQGFNGASEYFTAPETGVYYVLVDAVSGFDHPGNYTLSVSPYVDSNPTPNIFPGLPARPASQTVTSTQLWTTDGTDNIGLGTILYGVNLPSGNPSFGSPILNASFYPNLATVNNAGTIWNFSSQYSDTGLLANYVINSGKIVAEIAIPFTTASSTIYGTAYGALSIQTLDNSGEILASAQGGNAIAVYTQASFVTITNGGLIASQATYGYDHQQSGGAQAVDLWNGGALTNTSSGTIIAEGDNLARAVFIGRGSLPGFHNVDVINYGLIEAHATDPSGVAYGICITNLEVETGDIENYGVINAQYAIYAPSDPGQVFVTSLQLNAQTVHNHSGGIIIGEIDLFRGADTLINEGTIQGHVNLGEDNDTFDNTGGIVLGSVDLSFGNDQFIGSDVADAVTGGEGNDVIQGLGGDDLLLGGWGDDVVDGGAGNDGLYGEAGNDQLITLGGDFVSGGAGDDRIVTGDYAFAEIDGGSGYDVWALPTGARILDLGLVAASGRVARIEEIAMQTSQTLIVHEADVAALTGSSQIFVSGAGSDALYLVGGWSGGATVSVNGVTYAHYISGGATLFAQAGITVTVGSAPPTGVGLDAVASGAVAPLPGSVSGADLAAATLEVAGFVLTGDLTIGPDEVWHSSHGGVIGADMIGGTFTNYGSVIGENATGLADAEGLASAIYMNTYGRVINWGTFESEATGQGQSLAFQSGAPLANHGAVHAIANYGDATAVAEYSGNFQISPPSISNDDDIFAFSQFGFATGAFLRNGGDVVNSGTIEAQGGDGSLAIQSFGPTGIENTGSILAHSPLSSTYYATGILADGYFNLHNGVGGIIAAEIAIQIRTRYSEAVSIANDGTIYGAIIRTHLDPSLGGNVDITNTGSIYGSISLETGTNAISIINSGLISGDIFFNSGDNVYDGRSGSLDGVLYAGDGKDLVVGGTGSDDFFGEAGNDTLTGNAGNDTLNGGLGVDTSNYSSASTLDSWHRNPDGSWTVNAGAEGTDTLSSVEFLHFTDRDVALHNAARTFSGDGTSDVLFRRSDGVMASWEVSGTSISQAHFLPTAPSQWHVLGTGDFTGDGKDDILWQRTDGLVYTWIMDGGTVAAATPVTGVGAEWSCLGVGDFNGDQHADIAWQRNDGLVSIWTMNGASITQASTVTGLSSVWHLQGIGDFNSDGRDDFLWRRSDTGQMAIWEMNGSTIQTSGVTSQQAGLEWSVKGVGDFNGDGRDDILMQRGSDGMVELWTMNGLNVTAQTDIAAINPSQWSIHNIGDYNGDGKDDILWQRSDGLVYVWLMNGPNIIGAGGLSGLDHTWGII